ncbi:MAG: S41 family peptidase [Brevefilum sp.]|jgi:carboxyl-terminal processing protease
MHPFKEKKFQSTGVFIVIQVAIVILAMAVGGLSYHLFLRHQGEFGLLAQAKEILTINALNELPSQEQLEYGMIRGMLETLNDPYTTFVEPATHVVQSNELVGSFGGIGARLERDTQLTWRFYPVPDSPALIAGIQDGDVLLGVDDLEVTSTTDDIVLLASLRGKVGEKVTITIQRDNQILTFVIKRQAVALPSVSYHLLPEELQIGFIKINRIAETSADEVGEAIRTLNEQGATAFILDLRDNGGGLVNAGIEIARLFLDEGEIMHHQVKDQKIEIISVDDPGRFHEVPLVALINENTASSAEIVAGALKKHSRATLIGNPTFGKTTIQYVFDLRDGSSVHITSGQWWIDDIDFPLLPDIIMGSDANENEGEFILQAIQVLAKYIK